MALGEGGMPLPLKKAQPRQNDNRTNFGCSEDAIRESVPLDEVTLVRSRWLDRADSNGSSSLSMRPTGKKIGKLWLPSKP
jgi:hypothetical protein